MAVVNSPSLGPARMPSSGAGSTNPPNPPHQMPADPGAAWSDWEAFVRAFERVLAHCQQDPTVFAFRGFANSIVVLALSDDMQRTVDDSVTSGSMTRRQISSAPPMLATLATTDPGGLIFQEFREYAAAVKRAEETMPSEGRFRKVMKRLLGVGGTVAESAEEFFEDHPYGKAICKALKEASDIFS